MNYAVVSVGGIILLVVVGWFVWGRGRFGGSVGTLELDEREDVDEKEGVTVKER